jgi:hypothetical protein
MLITNNDGSNSHNLLKRNYYEQQEIEFQGQIHKFMTDDKSIVTHGGYNFKTPSSLNTMVPSANPRT